MTEVITAKQKALQAVLLTSTERDESRFSDVFWSKLINIAWDGKSLSDRRSHRAKIQVLLNEAMVQHQGLNE